MPAMVSSGLPVNSSLLLLSNMSSMMTVKLDYGNYVVWKHQIEVILDTYSMIDVLDNSIIAPERFLKDSSGNVTTEINPAFIAWKNREQAMFTFLNSTLSPAILALTVGQKSARGVWRVLEKRFASISRSHVIGNYVVWKHQIEVILDTYSMIDVLDNSIIAPERFLKDSSGNVTTEINPAFIAWKNREQAMFTFLNSTLSPAILALTVGQKSARGLTFIHKVFLGEEEEEIIIREGEVLVDMDLTLVE
nr:hypothetical protein CFP56_65377 [Quercus suber]